MDGWTDTTLWVIFKLFINLSKKIIVFCYVILCTLVARYQVYRTCWYLGLQRGMRLLYPEHRKSVQNFKLTRSINNYNWVGLTGMCCIYFHSWLLNRIYLNWGFLVNCRINGCRRRWNLCIGISCIIEIVEIWTGSTSHYTIIMEHGNMNSRIIQMERCCNI